MFYRVIILLKIVLLIKEIELSKTLERAAGHALPPYFCFTIFRGCCGKLIVIKGFCYSLTKTGIVDPAVMTSLDRN